MGRQSQLWTVWKILPLSKRQWEAPWAATGAGCALRDPSVPCCRGLPSGGRGVGLGAPGVAVGRGVGRGSPGELSAQQVRGAWGTPGWTLTARGAAGAAVPSPVGVLWEEAPGQDVGRGGGHVGPGDAGPAGAVPEARSADGGGTRVSGPWQPWGSPVMFRHVMVRPPCRA